MASGLTHLHDTLRGWSPDVVVPVPSHSQRLAERGYNPAGLLAAELARALAVPLDLSSLRRSRHTTAQASLPRAARLQSPRGSFALTANGLTGARILLVDDVRTTGATLEAARTAIAAAPGAQCLCVTLALSET